jgi:hypothetical protein
MVLFSNDFLKNAGSSILSEVFTHFFPISIQSEAWQQGMMYFGFSEQFTEVKEFGKVPTYVMMIEEHTGEYWFKGFTQIDMDFPVREQLDKLAVNEDELSTITKL